MKTTTTLPSTEISHGRLVRRYDDDREWFFEGKVIEVSPTHVTIDYDGHFEHISIDRIQIGWSPYIDARTNDLEEFLEIV